MSNPTFQNIMEIITILAQKPKAFSFPPTRARRWVICRSVTTYLSTAATWKAATRRRPVSNTFNSRINSSPFHITGSSDEKLFLYNLINIKFVHRHQQDIEPNNDLGKTYDKHCNELKLRPLLSDFWSQDSFFVKIGIFREKKLFFHNSNQKLKK